MLGTGTPFLRVLNAALMHAGWQFYPASNRWRHDGAGCEVKLFGAKSVKLEHPSDEVPLIVPSRLLDQTRAAYDVAAQLQEIAIRLERGEPLRLRPTQEVRTP